MGNQTEATAQQAIAEQNNSANAATNAATNAAVEGTVKNFSLKVVRVQLFEDADVVNVQLSFDKAIPGFVRDDEGNYIETDVDRISISRSALTRQLCENNEMIATMRDGQATPLTRAQISTVLHGANVLITRTYHAKGFVPENHEALTRPQWFTDINGVILSKFAQQLIQQLVVKRMLGE